jgi:hypothetical protein
MACCGAGSCPGHVQLDPGGDIFAVRCALVQRDGAAFRACAELEPETAGGAVGAPCQSDQDCLGDCIVPDGSGEGVCSDMCCTDEACGDPSAFRCRAHGVGSSWALRCEPN